jgi:hypothetical protein
MDADQLQRTREFFFALGSRLSVEVERTQRISDLEHQAQTLTQRNERLSAQLGAILRSRSWRFLQKLKGLRLPRHEAKSPNDVRE